MHCARLGRHIPPVVGQFVQLHRASFQLHILLPKVWGATKKVIYSRTQLAKHLCFQHSFKLPTTILSWVPTGLRQRAMALASGDQFQSRAAIRQSCDRGHPPTFPETVFTFVRQE